MEGFNPFADESASIQIDGMTVENRLDRVAFYGSLDITRDKHGIELVRQLQAVLDGVVARLKQEKDLPENVELVKPVEIENPFA